MDEITSPLYKEDVQIVKHVMYELRDEGCIILFISHRMHELFDICDSVTVMKMASRYLHIGSMRQTSISSSPR